MPKFQHLRDRLDRMAVSHQLYVAFASLILLTAVVGAIALSAVTRVDAQAMTLASKWLQGVGQLAEARTQSRETRDYEVKFSRTDDKSYHSEYAEKITEANKVVTASVTAYEALVASDAEREMFAKLKTAWGDYAKAQDKVIALGKDKKQQDAADFSDGAASMAFDEVQGALAVLIKFGFEGGDAAAAQANAVAQQAKWLLLGLLGAAILLGVMMALALTRRLIGQLGGEPRDAVRVARAVAEGDLTTQFQLRSGDTRSLMAVLQAMQHSLAETVTNVRQGSESVATASVQIAQGNQDLSSRTEQQASALQQTAATMDELGSTVRNNSDNARQANQLALGASTVAQQGGAVVGKVVETMKGINDSSKKIADIISVIDGIAFQTNILALNAAVEAARAGEQGRGFAVVASEVRSLAQRSAQAAKEIKGLISASVERVEQGTVLVDQAGKTMTEIVGAIQRVTDIVAEISSASEEQSSGVGQVGQAITQMDQTTQQNAALVEESAAAAESLRQQAQQLVQAVAVFKVPAQSGMAPMAVARPPASAQRSSPVRPAPVARAKPAAPAARPAAGAKAPAKAPAKAAATTASDDWESF